ncbi:MAG: glycine--tRNA ligase [bacterium]
MSETKPKKNNIQNDQPIVNQGVDSKTENITSFAKRRAFVFSGSEIYGGLANSWDFGPYGVLLKQNIQNLWWQDIVQKRFEVVALDSTIFMNSDVWRVSGHTESFNDPMVDCEKCKRRFRADDASLAQNLIQQKKKERVTSKYEYVHFKVKCPVCGGKLSKPRQFNLMFKTYMGPVEQESSQVYLRPETAQGSFINFKNIIDTTRVKLPFGIAQIGKSFRNEITPGNFIFRTREFEQMELEYFVKPENADKVYKYWIEQRLEWYKNIGISEKNLRLRQHDKKELAHYALATTDIDYKYPFGWSELEGIANRGDYDLKVHEKASGKDLSFFDESTKKKITPYVVEPAGGVDRTFLAILCEAYTEEKVKNENRIVLKFHPKIAPVKIAVLPLVKKELLPEAAQKIFDKLKDIYYIEYDEVGSIGRRYRRQDEIGTPYCITVDFDTLKDDTVTVRERDSMKQVRIKANKLQEYFSKKL